ncbi:hypothetical protein JTE90_000705 [Oedothorax gibbosus]|uniref:cysteine--tRNA ligase n=1 Tax=Oedothorax gibbosus TaxID=931172 RepID=A0AAV6UR08_9ARAC|nr:hypothetical protein JTE90_000705 [Oedothorax gibbosus]
MSWFLKLNIRLQFTKNTKLQLSLCSLISKNYSSYFGKWEFPQGHPTPISVYNSAVNKKVPLILKKKDVATWYICGPTVYDESHIGHASCYIKFDNIIRIMENVFNIKVFMLLGITDIDDKIIKKSLETGLEASEISKKYEEDFFKDMAKMQVVAPSSVSRVTENIPQIISFCEKLIEKNYAYVTSKGNVYFMVSKSVSADVLFEMTEESNITIDPLKKDRRDFALWKASKENELSWLSPWGKGRPGWHIECSVMASNVFGSELDLHSGGYDLLFPHHCNEKSQSEAYHGCSQWVNYWLHSGLLQIGNDVKMSKSVKNTISVKEFLKHNSANDFRILCLQSLYRKNISYNSETLAGAKGLHKKFHIFINEIEMYTSGQMNFYICNIDKLFLKLKETQEEVVSAFSDDFNTTQALLALGDLIDEFNSSLKTSASETQNNCLTVMQAYSDYIDKTLTMLGVNIVCKKKLKREFIEIIDAVTNFRNQIRLLALNHNDKVDVSTASSYINRAYAECNDKLQVVLYSEASLSNVTEILNALNLLYNKSSKYIAVHYSSNSDITGIKKKKIPELLNFCDELRNSLENYGISVKDRKEISTWLPLTTVQEEVLIRV